MASLANLDDENHGLPVIFSPNDSIMEDPDEDKYNRDRQGEDMDIASKIFFFLKEELNLSNR